MINIFDCSAMIFKDLGAKMMPRKTDTLLFNPYAAGG